MGQTLPGDRTDVRHLKANHPLDRCWLKGYLGDALRTVMCAEDYSLRWLLRSVGLKAFFVLYALWGGLSSMLQKAACRGQKLVGRRAEWDFVGPTT